MAVASYTTDLNDISTCEAIGTWVEMPGHTSGGAATVDGESYIQGSNCVSQSTGTKTGILCGLEFDYGSDLSGSMSTGDCFFFWQVFLAAANVYPFASGGLRVSVGSSAGNRKFWKTGGNDFGKYPYGGWQNFVIDPTYAADYTDGSPTSAYQFFGSLPNIIAKVSKGNPHGVDVIRYGRGEIIIENGDVGNGYGTFNGVATQNDSQTNRWGLFQAGGVGYLWKGLLSFGTSASGCDFRDSNVNVTIDDTPRTYASFNQIEVNNASSRVDWTGISFTAVNVSQLSIGQLEVIDNADVNFDTCTFTDMGTFIFQSNSTINDTTFRRCGQVTQGGAVFDGCIFEESTASGSLYVNNLDNIDNCAFYSDGSNHAMELDTTHSGNSYTLTGCTYTNYATISGITGNECIYNNSGGAVTIYVVGGDQPSIRNGSGASTSLPSSIALTMTVKDEAGVTISEAYAYIDNNDASPYILNTTTNSVGAIEKDESGPNCKVDIDAVITRDTITSAIWDEPTIKHLDVGSYGEWAFTIADNIVRTLGLTQENYYLDQTVYTEYQGVKLLTSGRLRIYSAAGSVGTGSNLLATYQITSIWTGDELQNYKVVKQ